MGPKIEGRGERERERALQVRGRLITCACRPPTRRAEGEATAGDELCRRAFTKINVNVHYG